MEFQFNLGKALNTLKAQMGFNNKDVARIVGRSEVTVSQWINDKQSPSLDALTGLCYECEIQFSEFVKWGE